MTDRTTNLILRGDGYWTAEGLRAKVKYVVDSYGLPMQKVVEHPDFASAGNLDLAALTRWDGLMYIEAVQRICISYVLQDLPKPSAGGLRQQGRGSRRLGGQPSSTEVDNRLRNFRSCFRSTYIYGEQTVTKKPTSPTTEEVAGAKQEEAATSVADAGPHTRVADFLKETFPLATPVYKQNFFEAASGHKSVGGALAVMTEEALFTRLRESSGKAPPVAADQTSGLGEQSTAPNPPVDPRPGPDPVEVSGATAQDVPGTSSTVVGTPAPSSALVVTETAEIGPLERLSGIRDVVIKSLEETVESSAPHGELRVSTRSATRLIPKPEELAFITSFAPAIARSGFYPSVNTVEKATVLMLKGLSMGIQAMDALDGFDVIEDETRHKITLYPRVKLLKARVNETGQCRRFDVVSADDRCTVTIQREGRPQNVYTFTLAEATKMGLLSHYGWKVMPKRMLMWRACGLAISMEFPEVSFGLGVSDGEDEEAA